VAALLLLTLLPASTANAASKHVSTPPRCRPAQLRPSIVLPKTPYTPLTGLNATVWYTNVGATCSLEPDNVPVMAVSGPSHSPVGIGSLSGAVAFTPMTLTHGERAFAPIVITSITTPQMKTLIKRHGGFCGPVNADGIVLESSQYSYWPHFYFALPEKVPVCTKGYYNVAAGVINKVLSPSEKRQAAYVKARFQLEGFLATWRSEGPNAAQILLVPSQRGSTVKLKSEKLLSMKPFNWTSVDHFVLLVTMDLRFSGSQGAWNTGVNTRFVTFSRPNGMSQYLLEFNTGP
jgi:hypothetical protein